MTCPPHEWNSTDNAIYGMGKMDMTDDRYGNRKVGKMRAEIDHLRRVIRAEGTPAIQDALDAVEDHLEYAYRLAAFRPADAITDRG